MTINEIKTATETTKAMTQREFLNGVLKVADLPEALKEYAETALEKLDSKNKSRSSKPTKAQLENVPLKAEIMAMFDVKPDLCVTASECGATNGYTPQKATSLLRSLVADGKLASMETKIAGKGKVKVYFLPKVTVEDGEE